jgi:nicotinate-nucleotide adenylyltransferase
MTRIFLGGSFNPIHFGHLICARSAAEAVGASGVVLIPAALSPFKPGDAGMAAPADRLNLCRLAVQDDPFFSVSDVELLRHASGRVVWLIGADILPRLHHWHRIEEIDQVVEFLVMNRAGRTIDFSALHPTTVRLCRRFAEVPEIEISSTVIRERIHLGKSIRHLTHDAVIEDIERRRLYRADAIPLHSGDDLAR